jgi:hypothetical protein
MPVGVWVAEANTLAGRPRVSPCSTFDRDRRCSGRVEQVGGQAAGAVGVGDVFGDADGRGEHPRRTRQVAHRRYVHEAAEETVAAARRGEPVRVWADPEQRWAVLERYQHAWYARRGDAGRVARVRIVGGEPERVDDRARSCGVGVRNATRPWSNHTSIPVGRRIATVSNVRPPVCWRSGSSSRPVRVNRTACAATVP